MRAGVATYTDYEWVGRRVDYHLARAEQYLWLLGDGDQQQDHLSHATTRLLMALMLWKLTS
jgi:hypothetical protein